jgi:hypothetical protein
VTAPVTEPNRITKRSDNKQAFEDVVAQAIDIYRRMLAGEHGLGNTWQFKAATVVLDWHHGGTRPGTLQVKSTK